MKFLLALQQQVFALHARVPQNLLRSAAAIPRSVSDQRGQETLVRHGQGCGSCCGCVCDVQISVDREGVVSDASFAAKRVALRADGTPLRSRAGKLLLHDCPCDTVRSLGSIATSECKGETLESLRNRLLFSPAAPPSFLRTILRKVGAPSTAAVCTQVVEEALTTALTDRPYSNAFASYYARDAPRPLLGGSATARANGGGGHRVGGHPYPYGGSYGGRAGSRSGDEGLAEEHDEDDLAEVDFRQQYDDFA